MKRELEQLIEEIRDGARDNDIQVIGDLVREVSKSLKTRAEILQHQQLMRLKVGDRVIVHCPKAGIHNTLATVTQIRMKKIKVNLDHACGKWHKNLIVPMNFVRVP